MKFRTIFILFNVVIAAAFLFVFFLPILVLGSSSWAAFWKGNWYLAVVFLALLGGLNAFFLVNRTTFRLVEREDWSELSAHLVSQMFPRSRFRSSRVRLLVNAYLLQSDIAGIEALESELSSKRPDLLRKNALLFGVTRLLRNKSEEAEAFFKDYLGSKDVESLDWLRFDYGFSLVLQKRLSEALPFLEEGGLSRDPVLRLISAYLLGSVGAAATDDEAKRAAILDTADQTRARLRSLYTSARWSKEVERSKSEVHIVILSRLIDDAGRWLYAASVQEKQPDAAPVTATPGGTR